MQAEVDGPQDLYSKCSPILVELKKPEVLAVTKKQPRKNGESWLQQPEA